VKYTFEGACVVGLAGEMNRYRSTAMKFHVEDDYGRPVTAVVVIDQPALARRIETLLDWPHVPDDQLRALARHAREFP
jgi:hypothetical protein